MSRTARLSLALAIAPAALALLSLAHPLAAQVLKGHNSNAPVDFSADRIEVQQRADRVVVTGNVQAVQAGMTLTAQRLTVAYHDASGVEIDRLDASGNVVVTRGSERASGDVAIYDLNKRLITMLGKVTLNQGTNRLTGSRLVIDLTTGRSTVDGAGSPRGGTTTSNNGRVSGTFKVRQSGN
jgi:lipopolysaccharide export system protein LptA